MICFYIFHQMAHVLIVCINRQNPLKNRVTSHLMSYAGGLFSCFSDCGTCCYVMWCAPCAHAENVALINEENCGCCHLIHCYSEFYVRRNISKKLGEPVNDCNDCCAACCFPAYLICQNQRALKIEGLTNNSKHTDAL